MKQRITLTLHLNGSATLLNYRCSNGRVIPTARIKYQTSTEAILDLLKLHASGLITWPSLEQGAELFFYCRPMGSELPYSKQAA